jgi:hypothetical protein
MWMFTPGLALDLILCKGVGGNRNPGDDPDHAASKSKGTGSSEAISYSPASTGRYYDRVYGCTGYSTSPYSLRMTYDWQSEHQTLR